MAELEVAKHVKKTYKVWKNPEAKLKHKIGETVIEIAIIVFAITLSLWLHNWSEHRHSVQEEQEFLTGLKIDLQQDIREMQSDQGSYKNVLKGFQYFATIANGASVQSDSAKNYQWVFYNSTHFNPNDSRFEGLKASGKISIIEKKELLNAILELYQEDIPFLNYLNDNFNTYKKQRLEPFLDEHVDVDDEGNGNWEQVFHLPEARNQIRRFLRKDKGIDEIIRQYQIVSDKSRKIISLIDTQKE